MAALDWEKNIIPIPVSELQPYAEASEFSRPMRTACNPERDAITNNYNENPEKSYIMYLHRTFGFPHTSPDTMTDSDFERASQMALWTYCEHCDTIFKDEDRHKKHLKPKKVDEIMTTMCPCNPQFTDKEREQAKFNCSLCKKNFDSNKRAKKALQQHLKAKSHMAKVNTENEHKEHERLCKLVGIDVD